jgi:hypothetical protein
MASILKVNEIQHTNGTNAMTIDTSGNITGGTHSLIATVDATPSASTYQFTMDYDDYNEFFIIVDKVTGDSSSSSENWDVKFVMDGVLDDGESTPYFCTNAVEYGTIRNLNAADNMEFFTTNLPTKEHSGIIHCVNFSNNDRNPQMYFHLGGETSNNYGDQTGSTGISVKSKQVTAIRFAFTSGEVAVVKLKIYGVN